MNHTEFIRAEELKPGDLFKTTATKRLYSQVLETYTDSTVVTIITTTGWRCMMHYTQTVIVKTPRNITT